MENHSLIVSSMETTELPPLIKTAALQLDLYSWTLAPSPIKDNEALHVHRDLPLWVQLQDQGLILGGKPGEQLLLDSTRASTGM